jgi:hypothetical protein
VAEVVDLDALRPKKLVVKLGEKEIDVSFIPCGITFEVDEITKRLFAFDMDKVQEGGQETNEAFNIALELCSVFCTVKHPEMTVKWFRDNTDPIQVNQLATIIQQTLAKAYEGAEAYQGN